MDELLDYPDGSLGKSLGRYLFENSPEAYPIAEREDILRLLISPTASDAEDIGMHYFLLGNGDYSLKNMLILVTGAMLFPHRLFYFYDRYKTGKAALRFFDLDHFRMLHLPVKRIKDTFLLR